jgi:hypothetical protein
MDWILSIFIWIRICIFVRTGQILIGIIGLHFNINLTMNFHPLLLHRTVQHLVHVANEIALRSIHPQILK